MAPDAPDASPWRRPLNYFDSLGKIVAGLTGLVALVTGIVTLVYLVTPDAPPHRKATLSVAKVVGVTSLRRYLLDSGQSSRIPKYKHAKLVALGNYYYLHATLEGLHGTKPEIFWSVNNASRILTFDDPHWIHQRFATIKPPSNDFGVIEKVWIQHPPSVGKFYAVFEVDYPSDQTLSTTSTPSFRVFQPASSVSCRSRNGTLKCLPPDTDADPGIVRPPGAVEPSH
jgi:hypothetical protein